LGIIPYAMPGSLELANATIKELDDYDVVMWEKHGVCAVGENIMEAFDMVDTLSKSAQIYLISKSMGFTPEGASDQQMEALKQAFHLPK
jgi:rhamnulose-1-phosphate aldolase